MLHVSQGQAHGERGHAAEQGHRDGEKSQDAEEGTEQQRHVVGGESGGSQRQQRAADHRDQAYGAGAPGCQTEEGFRVRGAISQPPPKPGAGRQVEQDQADQIGPHDQRIAKPGVEQPRAGQLNAQGDEAGRKNQQVEETRGWCHQAALYLDLAGV